MGNALVPLPKKILLAPVKKLGNCDARIRHAAHRAKIAYRAEPWLSTTYTGNEVPTGKFREELMFKEQAFAEVWFLGDDVTFRFLEVVSLCLESGVPMRNMAPYQSEAYNFFYEHYDLKAHVQP